VGDGLDPRRWGIKFRGSVYKHSLRALHNSFEQALPRVREHALRRTDQIRPSCLLSSQADHDRGGIGERDAHGDCGPARQWGPLQTEEAEQAEHPAKETRSMLARLPNSSAVQVGGRQERFCCRLGFQGTIAIAPSVVWIHAMRRRPQ